LTFDFFFRLLLFIHYFLFVFTMHQAALNKKAPIVLPPAAAQRPGIDSGEGPSSASTAPIVLSPAAAHVSPEPGKDNRSPSASERDSSSSPDVGATRKSRHIRVEGDSSSSENETHSNAGEIHDHQLDDMVRQIFTYTSNKPKRGHKYKVLLKCSLGYLNDNYQVFVIRF
jgi:hypothetical protein